MTYKNFIIFSVDNGEIISFGCEHSDHFEIRKKNGEPVIEVVDPIDITHYRVDLPTLTIIKI